MNIDQSRQYLQSELPQDVFNAGHGEIRNFNGRAVKVGVNGNGTRSLADLGDWGTYQQGKAITDAQAANKSEMNARFTQNRNDLSSAIDSYTRAIPGVTQAAQDKFGVNTLLGMTNALESRISDLKDNISGYGAGGTASAGQVDKAINNKYLPQYNSSASNLGRAATLAQGEISTNLSPYTTRINTLNEQIARESSGYSQEQQNELTALLTKYQTGVQMSENEKNRMNQLAVADKQFDNEIKKLSATIDANKNNPQNRYVNIGNGDQLYDVLTGKIVANNPKTFAGSAGGSTWY